jgi:uncharacterized membrane protein HdeD (DUF308 family)
MTSTVETLRSSFGLHMRRMGWGMILRGVVAVLFGLIALRSPYIGAAALTILFAIYAFADGAFDIVIAAQLGSAGMRWGWYVFAGIASIALGVIALAYPGMTLLLMTMLVGIYAIAHGIFELVAASSMHEMESGSRALLGLTGVVAIVLGIVLFASPVAGTLALVWSVSVFAILYGVALLGFGIRVLSTEHHITHEPHPGRPAAAAG